MGIDSRVETTMGGTSDSAGAEPNVHGGSYRTERATPKTASVGVDEAAPLLDGANEQHSDTAEFEADWAGFPWYKRPHVRPSVESSEP
jgi:hypothetical protein